MQLNERFDIILDLLKKQKRANIAELSALLYVSEATVRRDLGELQHMGLIRRTHGGAIYADASEELPIDIRQETNVRDKEAVAYLTLPHIPEAQTIFIDNSSTCLTLVQRMNLRYKTVITNGFRIAAQLQQQENVTVIMPGGELNGHQDFAGPMTINALRNFHFDLMICSCAAIAPDGAYEGSLPVKELKATALERSDKRLLLVDRSKFSHSAPFRTGPLGDYDAIYTNADAAAIAPYVQDGIRIYNK